VLVVGTIQHLEGDHAPRNGAPLVRDPCQRHEEERMSSPDETLKVSRRRLLRHAAAGAVALPTLSGVLAACGSSSGSSGGGAAAASDLSGTVRLLKGPFTDSKKAETTLLTRIAQPFVSKHAGLTEKIDYYDWANFQTTLTTQFAGSTPPDIPYLTGAVLPTFGAQGALVDLTERVKGAAYKSEYAHIPEALWAGGSVDGKIYGVPWVGGTFPVWVNLDLLEKAGVSPDEFNTSYEAFADAARKMTKGNTFGYGQGVSYKDYSYQAWLPYTWGAGADVFSKDAKSAALDTPDSAAAWDFLRSLYADGSAAPGGKYPAAALQSLFTGGRLGMFVTSMGISSQLKDSKFNWGIFSPPPGPTGKAPMPLDYGYLTLSAKGKNQDAAWATAKYLASAKPVTDYLNGLDIGFLSGRDDTPDVNAANPKVQKANNFVPEGRTYPTHPKTLDALRAACDAFELCLAGKQSGAAAVKSANGKINDLLSS
jgi:ABC-type glycerol-3-phosphate transport system substrate-binding protein